VNTVATLDFDNYEDLQDVVATYLQRANLTAQIPLFIQLAEARLGSIIKTLPQQVALPYALVPALGTNVITLPSDFGALIRATYKNIPLKFISPEQMDMEHTMHHSHEFTLVGSNFFLQTLVDGCSTLTLYYFQALQGLSDSNESNWLLEDYPNLYLYSTMLEAVTYLMDDERIQVWEELLSEAIQEATESARISMTPQKTKLTRTCS
jgi:hypothetical protein